METMDDQYSVQFFTSFIEKLQGLCKSYLKYSQFVEVSGYVCVEIDNLKKERYVLSELLQSSGNVVSESFCTKVFKASENGQSQRQEPLSRTDVRQPRDTTIEDVKVFSHQSVTSVTSQSVFPSRGSSDSMVLPHFPVNQDPHEGCSSSSQSDRKPNLDIGQFNLHRPTSNMTLSCSEISSDEAHQSTFQSTTSRIKRRKLSGYAASTPVESPASFSNQSCSSESDHFCDLVLSAASEISEVQVTLPDSLTEDVGDSRDPGCSNTTDDEVIDLDMFDDELTSTSADFSSSFQDHSLADITQKMSFDTSLLTQDKHKKTQNPGSLNVLKSVVKQFKKYHFEKSGVELDLISTPPEELNDLLLDYFMGAKKSDGSELTVGSLKNAQVYLERYLKQEGYAYSITRDSRFKPSRDYIKNKQDECGKVRASIKHIPIDDNDVEVMFQKNLLGGHNPDSLFNTMWFLNSKYFAKRKPREHFNMKWGDILLKVNENGQEYLERPINNSFSLKVFAKPEDPARCFVNFYKQYRDKRPMMTLDKEFPFYLKFNKIPGNQLMWFLPEQMMWSPFTYIWRKIVLASGLPLTKRIL
ncbi:uncharacterized protein [Haliotis asinina]|uniref:uncharacterized protein isoform X1 n=1 Tax=Haliotis asinina TaxID=109174 RepID=UPI00353277FD